LALVRYQPNSIVQRLDFDPRPFVDVRASTVVLADLVQPAPTRVLTLTRPDGAADMVGLAVSGATYSARRLVDGTVTTATSEISARLQQRRPDVEDDTLAWAELDPPASVALTPQPPDASGVVVWQGRLRLAPELPLDQGQVRLLVQEQETLAPATAPGVPATLGGRRVVYVDTVPL
jgi:hypothetical protein